MLSTQLNTMNYLLSTHMLSLITGLTIILQSSPVSQIFLFDNQIFVLKLQNVKISLPVIVLLFTIASIVKYLRGFVAHMYKLCTFVS